LNKFTLIIHGRGWLVGDACTYWGIRYATYNARCNNPKMFNQLECMSRGLEKKSLGDNTSIRTGNEVKL